MIFFFILVLSINSNRNVFKIKILQLVVISYVCSANCQGYEYEAFNIDKNDGNKYWCCTSMSPYHDFGVS